MISAAQPWKTPAVGGTQVGDPRGDPRHVSIVKGDILHIEQESYVVIGSIALGMPVRELTLHLMPAEVAKGGSDVRAGGEEG